MATIIDIAAGGKLINTGTIRADADAAGPTEITAAAYTPNPSYKDPAAFVQNGALQVNHDLTMPPFTQNSGTTTVASGKVLAAGNYTNAADPGFVLAGGTLTGNGRVYARTLTNSGGVVAPTPGGATNLNFSWDNNGESPSGHYVQTAGGTLRIRLAATGSALSVGSDVKLAGTLDVAPMLGYTPPAGQTYAIVRNRYTPSDRHYRTGTFATVTGGYAPVYENDGADVTIPGGDLAASRSRTPRSREGAIAGFVVNAHHGHRLRNRPLGTARAGLGRRGQRRLRVRHRQPAADRRPDVRRRRDAEDDLDPDLRGRHRRSPTRPSRSTSAIRRTCRSAGPTGRARSSTTT